MFRFTRSALIPASLAFAPALADAQQTTRTSIPLMARLQAQVQARETSAPASEGGRLLNAEIATLSNNGQRDTHLLTGWSGIITVTGFCDTSCGDLDIALVDSRTGEIVAQDIAADATPTVTIRTDAARDYNLRVQMYNCAVENCYFVTAVYFRVIQ